MLVFHSFFLVLHLWPLVILTLLFSFCFSNILGWMNRSSLFLFQCPADCMFIFSCFPSIPGKMCTVSDDPGWVQDRPGFSGFCQD